MLKKDKVEYVKKQGQDRNHTCHWPGCKEQVPPAMFMCRQHWFKLPRNLRELVWREYRPGQEKDMRPSRGYLEAARLVQDWIRRNHPCGSDSPNGSPTGSRTAPKGGGTPGNPTRTSVDTAAGGAEKSGSSRPWLLIDVNNLAWRAQYTTGKLSYNGKPTGVIFGVLRDVLRLGQRFGPNRPVFCLDHGPLLRNEVYPTYKANRVEDATKKVVRKQVRQLRDEILPALGFRNVFHAKGYEADDVIASVCGELKPLLKNRVVIVSGDQDLFQLLGLNVVQFFPVGGRFYTYRNLADTYRVTPDQWPMVKAIAGCASDNILGVKGVKEKTAAAYISNVMKGKSKKADEMVEMLMLNLPLVKLPYPGCPEFDLRDDCCTEDKWYDVCKQFGIRSLGI